MYELIKKKQLNSIHSNEEIKSIVENYTLNKTPDYQMAAWLMAIYLNGMNIKETISYTDALINSGEKINFDHLDGRVIDKHSTGGVGDKISLILGPILAACGCYIPMIVGRGLGHTGGTLDKLESIPNYNAFLDAKNFKKVVEKNGLSIIGQTKQICPADKKIYALRDLTATIESVPLICGSILSKKIAEGISGLVLDIKIGNGAFMKNKTEANVLGQYLEKIGKGFNLDVQYAITDMNQPLGKYSGLMCEIIESIETLKGNGPNDLLELTYHLGKKCLKIAGVSNPIDKIKEVISNGTAYEKFDKMVSYHGGNMSNVKFKPKCKRLIRSNRNGYLNYFNTKGIGMSIIELGGGRKKINDTIDYQAGIKLIKKHSDYVYKKDVIAEIFCSNEKNIENAKIIFEKSIKIVDESPKQYKLVY